jgi:hypothetical protein
MPPLEKLLPPVRPSGPVRQKTDEEIEVVMKQWRFVTAHLPPD